MTNHPHYDAPINKLARDVATFFDGTLSGNDLMDWSASVILPANKDRPAAKLYMRTQTYVKNPRVEVSIGPDFGPRFDTFRNTNGLPFPSATFSLERDFSKIIAAIAHRVVNQPDTIDSLKAFEARKQANIDSAANVLKHRDAILAAMPHAKANDANADRAVINGYSKGIGFAGHVSGNGHFYFSTIGSVPMEKALRIMAILTE